MSAAREMLCDTARAVFAEAATAGMAPVEASGFGLLPVPEEDGGFGGDWGDADAGLRVAGVMAPALPVAELIGGEALQPPARVSLRGGAMGEGLAAPPDPGEHRPTLGHIRKGAGRERAG